MPSVSQSDKRIFSFESSDKGLNMGLCVERREEALTHAVDVFSTCPQCSQCNRLRAFFFLSLAQQEPGLELLHPFLLVS